MRPALLIALPSGLVVSGVASWCVRLLGALAARGRPCGVILHASPPRHPPLAMPLDPRVRVTDLRHLPPLEDAAGDIEPYQAHYDAAARELADDAGSVVLCPTLIGDCYALCARTALREPRARLVAWLHSDIPYEYHLQRHFEPILPRFVPVSRTIERTLAAALPTRAADVIRIAHGVDMPATCPERPPMRASPAGALRPLRLVYAGRLEHSPKRVLALIAASDALTRRGVAHELAIVGDGPAAAELDAAAKTRPPVLRLRAKSPTQILGLLAVADIALLASTFEGLSLAVVEAMSRGCVPVVTRTDSGDELFDDAVSGILVDAPATLPIDAVGEALADGVVRAAASLDALRAGAFARARAHFSLDAHADSVERLLDAVASEPQRAWPADRPCAFAGAGGGSVPPDAPARLRRVLMSLRGRAVAVHGTGRHTLELRDLLEPLARAAADRPTDAPRLVAFTDDDPTRQGESLWGVPILPPDRAASSGATDVLISSWINQGAILARRDVYERQGLRVHALYD